MGDDGPNRNNAMMITAQQTRIDTLVRALAEIERITWREGQMVGALLIECRKTATAALRALDAAATPSDRS